MSDIGSSPKKNQPRRAYYCCPLCGLGYVDLEEEDAEPRRRCSEGAFQQFAVLGGATATYT